MLIRCECGKSLPAKPEWAGIGIRCAGCGRSHTIHEAVSVAVPEAVESDTKPCPHCAQRIKTAAIKCRHCGRMLAAEPVAVVAPPRTSNPDAGGLAPLLVGLFAWLFGCWLPSPLAWILGSMYEADCRARGVEPSAAGRAGKILGIVGTVFLLIGLAFFMLFVIVSVGEADGCR